MRTVRITVVVAASAFAASVLAGSPEAGAASAGAARPASTRMAMQARTGTLRNYRAGKSVVIAGPDGAVHTLAVDPAARVDRHLSRGQQVNVISVTDEAGRERVSAIARAPGAAAVPESSPSSPRP